LLNEDAAGELWLTAYKNHYKQDDPSFPHLADSLLEWQRSTALPWWGVGGSGLKERSGKPVCLTCKSSRCPVSWLPCAGCPAAQGWFAGAEQQAEPQTTPAPQSYNSAGGKLSL
jgi:hypothetical protein